MTRIKCFWIEPSDKAELSLRRFRFSEGYLKNEDGSRDYSNKDPNHYKCSNGYGCDASVVIGEIPFTINQGRIDHDRTDSNWPKVCTRCGRPFEDTDEWQRNENQLYIRKETGELCILSKAPVGAMWDATWFKKYEPYNKSPDGIVLTVQTPGGDWCVDGPSKGGGHWTRTGTVPEVTANPSILIEGSYHGWLRNGWLEEC